MYSMCLLQVIANMNISADITNGTKGVVIGFVNMTNKEREVWLRSLQDGPGGQLGYGLTKEEARMKFPMVNKEGAWPLVQFK